MNQWLVPLSIVLFCLFIVWVFYRSQRRKQERRDEIASQGFEALPQPDPALIERISVLHQRTAEHKIILHDFFRQQRDEQTLYFFDLDDISGKDNSTSDQDFLAVSDPRLNLPRFNLVPFPRAKENADSSTDLLEELVQAQCKHQGLMQVHFPTQPAFEQRYLLLAANEAAARAFWSEERINVLLQMEGYYLIDADGDLVTFNLIYPPRSKDILLWRKQLLDTCLSLAQVFADGTSSLVQ